MKVVPRWEESIRMKMEKLATLYSPLGSGPNRGQVQIIAPAETNGWAAARSGITALFGRFRTLSDCRILDVLVLFMSRDFVDLTAKTGGIADLP